VNYGTFFFPRLEKSGDWVLQTDQKQLIELMMLRNWDKGSPWQQCLSGTSYGFSRRFASSRNAKEAATRILSKLALESFEFVELYDGKGWEIKTSPTPQNNPNPCPYAGNYSKPNIKLERAIAL
jgi:hypothetical protein